MINIIDYIDYKHTLITKSHHNDHKRLWLVLSEMLKAWLIKIRNRNLPATLSFDCAKSINGAKAWMLLPLSILFFGIAVFPNVIAIASRQELLRCTRFFFNTMSRINDMKRLLVLQLFSARGIFRPRIVLSFNRISDIKSIYGSLELPSGRYPFFKPEESFFLFFFNL